MTTVLVHSAKVNAKAVLISVREYLFLAERYSIKCDFVTFPKYMPWCTIHRGTPKRADLW